MSGALCGTGDLNLGSGLQSKPFTTFLLSPAPTLYSGKFANFQNIQNERLTNIHSIWVAGQGRWASSTQRPNIWKTIILKNTNDSDLLRVWLKFLVPKSVTFFGNPTLNFEVESCLGQAMYKMVLCLYSGQ